MAAQYYDTPMSVEVTERCKYTARQTYNDIMNMVLNGDTDMEELVECLQRVSIILVHEMHVVRNAKSNLSIELEYAKNLEERGATELRKVIELSKNEAMREVAAWGLPLDAVDFMTNFNQNAKLSDPPKSHDRRFTPPSGRASPLLRTSSEAVGLPQRPQSIGEERTQQQQHSRSLSTSSELCVMHPKGPDGLAHVHDPKAPSPEDERATYQLHLQIAVGALRHRVFALQQMQDAFSAQKAPRMERTDAQLAILYGVYYSRGVRAMFNEEKNSMRPIEWAPLRETKRFPFSCALNYATENYHIALSKLNVSADRDDFQRLKVHYLARMWHMHSVNWVPHMQDAHLDDGLRRSASFSLSSSGNNFVMHRTQSMN